MDATLASPTARTYHRAPKGGLTSPVNDRFYRGGWFMPLAREVARQADEGTGPAIDVTRDDFVLKVTNPATRGVRTFRVQMQAEGSLAGKRTVEVWSPADGVEHMYGRWVMFGFATDFGVSVWGRFREDKSISGKNGYVAMLEEPSRFIARGLRYRFEAIG